MGDALKLILEKADFDGFLAQCTANNEDPLAVRLDGINLFSAILVCNASSEQKIKLFTQALAAFPDKAVMQVCLDESMTVSTPMQKQPQEKKPLPFIIAHLPLPECETLLEGLLGLGVVIPEKEKAGMKDTVLGRFPFSKRRIEELFDRV